MDSLIKRLQEAESGSRELDALVWCAAFPAYRYHPATEYTGASIYHSNGSRVGVGDLDRYTKSIDAIVALIGEKLPGWRIAINSDHDRAPLWSAQIKRSGETWRPIGHLAPTPALALGIALLSALQSQEPTPDAK